MKKYFTFQNIILLFLLFQYQTAFSFVDSVRVTICKRDQSYCLGLSQYNKTVEHLDSAGNVIETNNYAYYSCDGTSDSALIHYGDNFYTYNALGQLSSSSTIQPDDSSEYRVTYSYDLNGNKIVILIQGGYVGNLINTNYDSSHYDSNNNRLYHLTMSWDSSNNVWDSTNLTIDTFNLINKKIYELSLGWNSTNNNWDTLELFLGTYDLQNRNIRNDSYNYSSSWELHEYFNYDVDSNLVTSIRVYSDSSSYDSSRYVYTYDALHHKLDSWYQQWDNTLLKWINSSRVDYSYDGLGRLEYAYNFSCPDSLCADTINQLHYYYDNQNRVIKIESPDNISFTQYDAYGKVIDEGWWITQFGCDESEEYVYTFNSLQQLVHSHYEHYTCEYNYYDCDYYNLGRDTMLVTVFYPHPQWPDHICPGDTIRPFVTVEGGTQPYTFLWVPSTNIINPHVEVPFIIADTTISYIFQATDSTGLSYLDTLNIYVYPVTLPNPFVTSQIGSPCSGNQLYLFFNSDSLPSNSSGEWYMNGDEYPIYNDTIEIDSSGIYYVLLYQNGCFVKSVPVNVTLFTTDSVSLGADTILCNDETLLLNAGNGFSSYLWQDGSTNSTLQAFTTAAGIDTAYYSVTVTDSNNCVDADTMMIAFTICADIQENENRIDVNIYPNPTSQFVTIEIPGGNGIYDFEMKDITGRIIKHEKISSAKTIISLSELSRAFYFYSITGTKGEITKGKILVD